MKPLLVLAVFLGFSCTLGPLLVIPFTTQKTLFSDAVSPCAGKRMFIVDLGKSSPYIRLDAADGLTLTPAIRWEIFHADRSSEEVEPALHAFLQKLGPGDWLIHANDLVRPQKALIRVSQSVAKLTPSRKYVICGDTEYGNENLVVATQITSF